MNDSEFANLIKNSSEREQRYREMVCGYYNRVTETILTKWNPSFHFAAFQGTEPLADAILATELMIARDAGFKPGMRVLDVGCGVGGPALNLAKHCGIHVTGVNLVQEHIEIATRRAEEAGLSDQTRFVLCDAMHLEFPDETFDAVYVFEAGCYMPNKPDYCREMARVLKPGGVVAGQDWFQTDDLSAEEYREWIEPICRFHGIPHLRTLSHHRQDLLDAGLVVEAVEDLAERGNIAPNWNEINSKAIRALHGLTPWLIPSTLRMMLDGGYALIDASNAGKFVVGLWRARKPEAA